MFKTKMIIADTVAFKIISLLCVFLFFVFSFSAGAAAESLFDLVRKAESMAEEKADPAMKQKIKMVIDSDSGNEDKIAELKKIIEYLSNKEKKETERRVPLTKKEIFGNIILIRGTCSCGSGFIAKFADKTMVISNIHVFMGNRKLRLYTPSGEYLKVKNVYFAKKLDLAFYEIEDRNSFLEIETDFSNKVLPGAMVTVFGNSLGGDVATELPGKVLGIGPEIVEVSSEFVSGNSGSPIISDGDGKVIGVATFAIKNNPNWVTEGTRFAEVRRYGLRLDRLAMKNLIRLDIKKYLKDLSVFNEFAEKNELGIDIVRDLMDDTLLASDAYESKSVKNIITQWNRSVQNGNAMSIQSNAAKLKSFLMPSYLSSGHREFSCDAMKWMISSEKKMNAEIIRGFDKLNDNFNEYRRNTSKKLF